MAGIRFPGTVMANGWLDFGGTSGGWAPVPATDTYITRCLEQSRLYIAPSRYSEVRKVTFTITFQHVQSAGTLATTFRARVGPSSTSATARLLESGSIPPSSRPITVGTGEIWSVTTGPLTNNAFYPINGSENQVAPRQVASPKVTTDSQTLVVEFDRTRAEDASFFEDWDNVNLTDNAYIAYSMGIQRDDLAAFVNNTASTSNVPTPVGFTVAVIQAPSPQNDSCTHIQATNGLYPDETMDGSLFAITKIMPFHYRVADWANLDAIHLLLRQTSRSGAINEGNFRVTIRSIEDEVPGSTVIYTEDFTPSIVSATLIARSADIKSFLTDNTVYIITLASLSGNSNQDLPWGWWEVIQKGFSRKSTFHPCGMGNAATPSTMVPNAPNTIGDYRFSADQSLFDPAWYEFMPSSSILQRRWFGAIDHRASNNTDLMIALNSDLAGDVTTSLFNQISDEVSSTPDVENGPRIRSFTITRVDPLNLAGRRVMKMRYGLDDWVGSVPDEYPGGSGFEYTYLVGNTEFPELGPLFDIGSFNPEGCASTAAGLGDSPGVLVITNGKTIPKKFNPTAGVIENAGLDTPYREQEPSTTTASVALSPDGGLTPGTYKYRYTLRNCCTGKESDPNPVDIVVDASSESPAASVTLSFAGVTIPADTQICEICIYRTILDGDFPVMAKVGCFDPDVTTLFVDSLSDSILDFTNDSLSILNGPMPCVSTVVEFRNRLFGMGDIPDLNPPGMVGVTNGSDILDGDGDTTFDRCVIGKFIQIQGDCTAYEILELLVPAVGSPQPGFRLKLSREYEGATDTGLNYIICGHPNRIYISEPLEPECWPGINFLDVDPGDGDRIMGAVSNFNRLVVCKRRKTYILAFRLQPITEIVVPTLVSKDIGCIAPRSFAQVSSGSVWLSDRGLALYDGRGVGEVPESSVMNELFTDPENPNYLRRDSNGRVIGAEGVFYPKRQQYLLLLPTVKTVRGASMILVWDTNLRNITLLEFCQEFLSIEVAKDSEGNERVYLGDSNGFVWIWDVGDTDGVGFPNATGTVRGTVTAAVVDLATGASYLEDSTAAFVSGGIPGIADLSGLTGTSGLSGSSDMGLAGACVFWRAQDAPLGTPWQSRFVYLSTSTRLYVTPNWGTDIPSIGDEYMIGPIKFSAEFKPSNYGTDDFTKRDWRQVLVHEPESVSTQLRTELLRDFQNSDIDEDTVTDSDGVTGEGRTFDLGFGKGRQVRPVGRLVHEFMGVRMTNFAPDEPVTILQHALMLVPRTSK